MLNLKTVKGKRNNKKDSLIQGLNIFPFLFFMVGLVLIFIYYTIIQIQKYNENIELIKKEFTDKQQTELKLRVLILKDYVYWVKSHPDESINKYLNNKIQKTENLLNTYSSQSVDISKNLPVALINSLNRQNAESVSKIFILNTKKDVLYSDSSQTSKNIVTGSKTISKELKYSDLSDRILPVIGGENHQKTDTKQLFIKNIETKKYSIGIYYDDNLRTKILQEIVIDSLSQIKYNNNEYVIINSFDGYALLSKGQKQMPPLLIKSSKEVNWVEIFKKELEFAKNQNGGYYTYFWRNSPDMERMEKTSYFSGIPEWEWIIGTGYFSADVLPVIKKMNAELWHDIIHNLIRFVLFIFIISLLAYLIMRNYIRKTKFTILQFLDFFKRGSTGFQVIDTSNISFSEFETMAIAANQMIEERERIKNILAIEKSRLRYMIDAIPDLIFFKDINSKFLGCNTAFENYINRKSDEILGLSETDLFPEDEAKKYIETDKIILQTLKAQQSTNWVEYKNGQKCLFYTLKTPYFDSDHTLIGIIGISRDITEMEETRLRLIMAKEKAEESDKLKTAFLANMSHEIRTPMNAIIGFSDLLADDDLTKEDKLEFISRIKSAGNSLITLINDIIDIAKIEAGQLRISESRFDINQILKNFHGTYQKLLQVSGKSEISIKMLIPNADSPFLIQSDLQRLQQILNNLLSNAIKFTESGTIEFGYELETNSISFFVKDTGIGILAGKQKHLFQRFNQLDSSTTRKYGGTGLGLAISKNLVELLGGTISMKSNPGKGSIFYFTIPLKFAEQKPEEIGKNSRYQVDWHGKTILIAEDILQNFILMEALLKPSGIRILHAVNGQKAIDIVKSESGIDLVLMDIQLPIKTGYEALKEIIELRPEIPVMSYTAFALPHEREKSIIAGFVEFIPKPIKSETLFPLLDKYLGKKG